MTWYNPMTWFKAAPRAPEKDAEPQPLVSSTHVEPGSYGDGVYVAVRLDRAFQGVLRYPPPGIWIKLVGISLEAAAKELLGRSINWNTIPMSFRARLEIDFVGLEMEWEDLKKWIV